MKKKWKIAAAGLIILLLFLIFFGPRLWEIYELGEERLPINMVVIYTNLSGIKDVGLIEDYAHTLEHNRMVGIVVVVSR